MCLRLVRQLVLCLLFASLPLVAVEDPLLETLLQVKAAYRAKHWDDADLALRHLLELASAPEREAVLPKILPAYHFYAAAVAWERKDEDRARRELARYFEFQPEATIDPGAYPKSYRLFFDAQREAVARLSPSPAPTGGLPNLARTAVDDSTVPVYLGSPDWPTTAVQYLLTNDEKRVFANLPDDGSRREWVSRFWSRLDPDPATSDNEYEIEFYRRVQYADATFSTETMRGSLSDRGRVLLILGPPTYVGRRALHASDDTLMTLKTTETVVQRNAAGGAGLVRVPSTNRGSVMPGGTEGEAEIWYYRVESIPKGLPFNDLEYRFYTKEGYGTGVFQKDARELLALQKAARLLRSGS